MMKKKKKMDTEKKEKTKKKKKEEKEKYLSPKNASDDFLHKHFISVGKVYMLVLDSYHRQLVGVLIYQNG